MLTWKKMKRGINHCSDCSNMVRNSSTVLLSTNHQVLANKKHYLLAVKPIFSVIHKFSALLMFLAFVFWGHSPPYLFLHTNNKSKPRPNYILSCIHPCSSPQGLLISLVDWLCENAKGTILWESVLHFRSQNIHLLWGFELTWHPKKSVGLQQTHKKGFPFHHTTLKWQLWH